MIHLRIVQEGKTIFSGDVLYFSFLDFRIRFSTGINRDNEVPLLTKWKIYKNGKLYFKNKDYFKREYNLRVRSGVK